MLEKLAAVGSSLGGSDFPICLGWRGVPGASHRSLVKGSVSIHMSHKVNGMDESKSPETWVRLQQGSQF